MANGRPTKPLILGAEEQSKLELMARRPKTDQRTALRARIVLECAAGKSNTAVAAKLKVTIQTVGKWRERFLLGRLGALGDAPRSGQPRKITDEQVEAVITRTLETRPKNATHWSTRSMAEASGADQAQGGHDHRDTANHMRELLWGGIRQIGQQRTTFFPSGVRASMTQRGHRR